MDDILQELLVLAGIPVTEAEEATVLPNENSLGKRIAPRNNQSVLKNFWNWFADSKIKDSQGRPLVLYHGTDYSFAQFEMTGEVEFPSAAYFTSKKTLAKTYGSKIIPVYLKISNPYVANAEGATFNDFYDQMASDMYYARDNGFDGVIIRNLRDDWGQHSKRGILADTYAVFDSCQIKAIENGGYYDANSENIYEAVSQAYPFKLPNGVPQSLFKLTNSMADVQKWKAKVLESYNLQKRKGSFDGVGYVMVSLKDNTIIPIARDDEHHRGEDLLYDYYQPRYGVNPEDYYPVFCDGSNYPYNEEEAIKLKTVLKKCKVYGLDMKLTTVNMYYIHHGNDTLYTAENFIVGKAKPKKNTRKLTKTGEELLKVFTDLKDAFEYRDARGNLVFSKIQTATKSVGEFLNNLVIAESGDTFLSDRDVEYINKQVEDYKYGILSEDDLMDFLFGFNGLRNRVHNFLRRWEHDILLNKTLGNVTELIEKLGAL